MTRAKPARELSADDARRRLAPRLIRVDSATGNCGLCPPTLFRRIGPWPPEAATKLQLALAELGLIDEYEFIVHRRLAGHGPTMFAGLSKVVDLKLVGRQEFG